MWDIDNGIFSFVTEQLEDGAKIEPQLPLKNKNKINDVTDVF